VRVLLVLACLLLVPSVSATVVQVSQSSAYVNEPVTLEVGCFPTYFVKGWELKIKYDDTFLRFSNVTIGSFFDPYPQFWINGTVDAANSSIINIYNLVIGRGNVSHSAQFCYVTFVPLKVGYSNVSLFDVGVCNESKYLPVTIINGSVDASTRENPIIPPPEPEPKPIPPVEPQPQPDSSEKVETPPIAEADYLVGTFLTIIVAVIFCLCLLTIVEKRRR